MDCLERLAINELTTYSWPFERDIVEYAAYHVGAVGVWRPKLTDFGVAKGGEMLADHNLGVSSLQWGGGFTGSDGHSFEDAVRDTGELIEMAAAIKAPRVIIHSGARAGHTHNHANRLFRMGLKRLLPRAEEHNVALAIEPMHPGCANEWTLLKTLEETAEILAEFPSPHLQFVYDMYHHPCPDTKLLANLMPRLGLVQLGDCCQPPRGEQNRCLLGDGEVPLRARVAELERWGYQGYYEVELRGEDVESFSYFELIQRSIEMFVALLDDIPDDAPTPSVSPSSPRK